VNVLTAITQADGFAISMLAILVLSLGTVLLILVAMLRHGGRRDAEVERLLDEVRREEEEEEDNEPAATADHEEPENREPWEKESDWWKQ